MAGKASLRFIPKRAADSLGVRAHEMVVPGEGSELPK